MDPAALRAHERRVLAGAISAAIERGVLFLESQQDTDGAWRSQTYGFMRDGVTLTPHVLSATVVLPESMASESTARGVDYLLTLDPETAVLLQPVYTAAATSWVLRYAGHEAAAEPWLDLIEAHQLTDQLGWPRTDPRYGGWSYAVEPPAYRSDAIDRTRPDANISATLFAVGALRLAGRLSEAQASGALDLMSLLQDSQVGGPTGGMWFSPLDHARNKAGVEWRMRIEFPIGHRPGEADVVLHPELTHALPYGSATADGVRVLLACGLSHDDSRVVGARDWLVEHFRADTVPGDFAPDREPLRHGYYHYYAWSVSHALRRLGVTHAGADRETSWAEQLALALLATQEPDGAWRNASTDGKEDDPLVATPFALSALAVCRNALMEMPAE
ncbi:MAG: hypothetical protein AAF078_04945 [Planctomycetota bacterium]